MKLNDDQRKVLQALLDGKSVKVSLISTKPPTQDFTFTHLYDIGDGETEYRIEDPSIKVALFHGGRDGISPMSEEESLSYLGYGWVRISDWVEIAPTRSDET